MPTDPFRLRVLKAITAELKTVTPANGYQSDLSDFVDESGVVRTRVFRGQDSFGVSHPRPMVSILEHPRAAEQVLGSEGTTVSTGGWDLLVQGFADDDPENPTDPAHILSAEVIQCLARARERRNDVLGLGGYMPCVSDLRIGSPVVRPADNTIADVAFFYVAVSLKLVEDLADPFA